MCLRTGTTCSPRCCCIGAGGADAWRETPMAPLGNDRWQASFVVDALGTLRVHGRRLDRRFASWRHGAREEGGAGQDVTSELLEGAAAWSSDVRRTKRCASPSGLLAVAASDDPELPIGERMAAALIDRRWPMRWPRRPIAARGDAVRPRARRRASNANGRGSARGTRCFRARPAPIRRAARRSPRPPRLLPYVSGDGLRRAVPAADPSDRPELPQGPEQLAGGRTRTIPAARGRSARRQAATRRSSRGSARWTISIGSSNAARRHGLEIALDHRLPGLARSSVGPRASGVVPASARRHDQVRGEPAEEVPGHLSDQLRVGGLAGAVGRAEAASSTFWVAPRRDDLPRRQPAHQAAALLGVGDRRDQAHASGRDLPVGSVHASEGDAPPRQGGFSQSYTYFTWRNTARGADRVPHRADPTTVREYLRPNLFANTPDILHEYLQHGGRPAFIARFVLAATLGASYGIYSGFELAENVPVRPGSEEYLDSEKYQIKVRDFARAGQSRQS